jgi:hypothetical protein
MPPKRRRPPSPAEKTKRSVPSDSRTSPWGWVGTEVKAVSALTAEHVLATCGFSARNSPSLCPNRLTQGSAHDKLDNDIIVITDEETSQCSRKVCKNNPNCLNYLGQEKWEDDGKLMHQISLAPSPTLLKPRLLPYSRRRLISARIRRRRARNPMNQLVSRYF